MVRFTIGRFLFFLNVDQRHNGWTLPVESWLHRLARGAVSAALAEMAEEVRMYQSLASSLPVAFFFGEIRFRRSQRA